MTTLAQLVYWKNMLQAIDRVLKVPQNYKVRCTIFILSCAAYVLHYISVPNYCCTSNAGLAG